MTSPAISDTDKTTAETLLYYTSPQALNICKTTIPRQIGKLSLQLAIKNHYILGRPVYFINYKNCEQKQTTL